MIISTRASSDLPPRFTVIDYRERDEEKMKCLSQPDIINTYCKQNRTYTQHYFQPRQYQTECDFT